MQHPFRMLQGRMKYRARAEALRNAFLGNLTHANNKLIKSHKLLESESSSAIMQAANKSPDEMYRIKQFSTGSHKQRMDMKAQREFHKENRKYRN